MKKFFQSKGFIVSVLVVLCVAILGVCWFVSRDRTENFKPDESPPSSTTSDWSDGGAQNGDDSGGVDAYSPGQSPSSEEEYPKVTSETESEVVIDFTDTDKPEETPPLLRKARQRLQTPAKITMSPPTRLYLKSRRRRQKNPLPAMSRPPAPAMAAAPSTIPSLGGWCPAMCSSPPAAAMVT